SESLLYHELTGLEVEVVSSTNSSLLGVSGVVVFETMKTLGLKTKSGRVITVPKDVAVFNFKLENGSSKTLDGKLLKYRPEERTAKWLRRSRRRT
ncbi:MAG: ribonuclease P protein subunit, partial [Candidatus Bathyarchaeia archaeon]